MENRSRDETLVRIAELYTSVQGEGLLTGTPSVFVRVAGCNLRCWFCDTPYTSWEPQGEDLPVDEILQQVERYDVQHVVLTGGEPMLFAELIPLCEGIRAGGRHITIETAGTLYLPVACDLMSISPKLSNSVPSARIAPTWQQRHERTRHAPQVIRRLLAEYPYQVKFVMDSHRDCQELQGYLSEFPELDRGRVLLMPQGTDPAKLHGTGRWLEGYCREHGFHFCPRKQIEWFGWTRGT